MASMHPDPRVPAPSLRICSLLILFPHGSICYLKSFNARSIMLKAFVNLCFCNTNGGAKQILFPCVGLANNRIH
jgi:hypothetical protein